MCGISETTVNDPASRGPDPALRVTRRVTPFGTVVTVLGEVDMDTATDLDEALRQASEHLAGAIPLAVNLRDVDFLGSAGLGVLLVWHRRCQAIGIPLVVVAPPRAAARMMRMAGLDRILTVVPELAAWSPNGAEPGPEYGTWHGFGSHEAHKQPG